MAAAFQPGGAAQARPRAPAPGLRSCTRARAPRGLSIRTALVYAGELDPEVAEHGYFDALVPIEDLPRK